MPPTPYHFEANELNFINGTYVSTYNNDWSDHTPWNYGGEKPTGCSMVYFTSKTPLVADSWTYGANYFKNTGENGMNYGNNHTHLHKYQGKWYLFYQANNLESSIGSSGVPQAQSTVVSAASMSMRLKWMRRTWSSRSASRPLRV